MTTQESNTVITVGITETDEYGNLWVTPAGGGDKIKIGVKRKQLHPIFQQGKVIQLHWETYMDKPYVSDAKQVTGESLPPPIKPKPEPIKLKISSDNTEHLKIKSMALAYIKDIYVALITAEVKGQFTLTEFLNMLTLAGVATQWLMGEVDIDEIKKVMTDEAKEAKPSKPTTAGTKPETKGTGAIPFSEQGEGQM